MPFRGGACPRYAWRYGTSIRLPQAGHTNTRAIAGVVRDPRDQADLRLLARPETLTVSRNYTHLFKQM